MQNSHLLQDLRLAFARGQQEGVLELDRVLINRDSFTLLRMEELFAQTRGVVPPFRQSDVLILFVKNGAGRRSIGPFTFTIENNSLAVIPSHVIHAATYTSFPVGYLLTFRSDFLLQQAFPYKLLNTKRVLRPTQQPYMVLSDAQAAELTAIFEKIIEECNSNFEEKKQMVALKLLELLLLCDRYFSSSTHHPCSIGYSELVQAFQDLVESHFTQQRSVRFYAGALHTHPNNLNLIVKKNTGCTAKQTISNRLLSEAKYLLASTSRSIKEIAFDLGFEDPNYFISFFKKGLQATPAQYRAALV